MTFDLANEIVGAIIGVSGSVLGNMICGAMNRRKRATKLIRTYGDLTGEYENYRVKDGVEEPTGGTIKITQRPDGLLEAKGLHSSGELDWSSVITMKLEPKNIGTGRYQHLVRTDYGSQEITFISETHSLHVVTTNISGGKHSCFVHHWQRPIKRW